MSIHQGKALKAYIKFSDISIADFTKKLDVSHSAAYNYFKSEKFREDTLQRILEALETTQTEWEDICEKYYREELQDDHENGREQRSKYIVAEITKNWNEGTPATNLISHQFEEVLNVNSKRGYKLIDWKMQSTFSGESITETIVAVFEDKAIRF